MPAVCVRTTGIAPAALSPRYQWRATRARGVSPARRRMRRDSLRLAGRVRLAALAGSAGLTRLAGFTVWTFFALWPVAPAIGQDVAQPPSASEKMFDVDLRGLPLSEALTRAADAARLDLAYQPEMVAGLQSSCQIRTPSATALLACVLDGTDLQARQIRGGAFLIQRVLEPEEKASARFTGMIVGSVTDSAGTGIPGANVVVRGTLLGDATDREGAYEISRVPEGNHVVVASSIGFVEALRDEIVVSRDDTTDVRFQLRDRRIDLQPMTVVAGYDRLTERVARSVPVQIQSWRLGGFAVGLFASANPQSGDEHAGEHTGQFCR